MAHPAFVHPLPRRYPYGSPSSYSASFGPDTLNALRQAFDEAWASIERDICDQLREVTRLKLATALLSVACDDSRDVEVLKKAALEVMAGDYRWQALYGETRH